MYFVCARYLCWTSVKLVSHITWMASGSWWPVLRDRGFAVQYTVTVSMKGLMKDLRDSCCRYGGVVVVLCRSRCSEQLAARLAGIGLQA